MLLKMYGQPSERLHAPFVSDSEIREHVSNLISENSHLIESSDQQSNITKVDFTKAAIEPKDSLYEQAIIYVRETKKASATSLQNKFKIGHQKASAIIDRLEEEGVIGARVRVNEPREVYE